MTWDRWVYDNLSVWRKQTSVFIPAGLPHPAYSGFGKPVVAEQHGQETDWVVSLEDGSRLHIHEYADGTMVGHV
ncbi:hypothetical protein IIB79_07960, partial [candidate division KSB1 bacterium]|nr:hypothetical protein [candidate division KSB1 bacterium]